MKIVAISGWAKSGKDTSADYLIANGYKRVAFADILKSMVADQYQIPVEFCHMQEFKETPLEQYPVTPKDAFSLAIAKMMFKEFRTLQGQPPMEYHIDASGAFIGLIGREPRQLYWTPRALCILEGSIKRSVNSNYWVGKVVSYIDDFQKDAPYTSPETGEVILTGDVVISDLRYTSEVTQLKQAFKKNLQTVRINRFDSTPSADASENDLNNHKFDVTIENRGTLDEFIVKLDMEILND